MVKILYTVILFLLSSATVYSQGFLSGGDAGAMMRQYSAPVHRQYVDYNYYDRSVVVKHNVPVVKSQRIDYVEYQPVYVEYNWITPSASKLPPTDWQGYQPYVVYPYRDVPCGFRRQLWYPYHGYWYYYPYSYQNQLMYFLYNY